MALVNKLEISRRIAEDEFKDVSGNFSCHPAFFCFFVFLVFFCNWLLPNALHFKWKSLFFPLGWSNIKPTFCEVVPFLENHGPLGPNFTNCGCITANSLVICHDASYSNHFLVSVFLTILFVTYLISVWPISTSKKSWWAINLYLAWLEHIVAEEMLLDSNGG